MLLAFHPRVLPVRLGGPLDSHITWLSLWGAAHPYRMMVLLAVTTGLRISEIRGLQWHDFDFENLEANLNRAVVHQVVGEMKTEASKKPIPIDPELVEALLSWKSIT